MDKFLKILNKTKTLAISKDATSLLEHLTEIKTLLVQLLLQNQIKELSDIAKKISTPNPKEVQPNPKEVQPNPKEAFSAPTNEAQAIDSLEKITTNRKDKSGKREFLLHRPTENYEYAKSIREKREYENLKPTTWYAEYIPTEEKKSGANPVVSCWIPESGIQNIPNPHINTGTWGELGKNPFAAQYKITVKPGIYEVYQEYRGE